MVGARGERARVKPAERICVCLLTDIWRLVYFGLRRVTLQQGDRLLDLRLDLSVWLDYRLTTSRGFCRAGPAPDLGSVSSKLERVAVWRHAPAVVGVGSSLSLKGRDREQLTTSWKQRGVVYEGYSSGWTRRGTDPDVGSWLTVRARVGPLR